jgi:hypothetical protein
MTFACDILYNTYFFVLFSSKASNNYLTGYTQGQASFDTVWEVFCSSRLAIETFKCFKCGSFFLFQEELYHSNIFQQREQASGAFCPPHLALEY